MCFAIYTALSVSALFAVVAIAHWTVRIIVCFWECT